MDQRTCKTTVQQNSFLIKHHEAKTYELHKKPSLYFEEHCTKIENDILFIIGCFFIFQTNLVFKFNLVLIK